MSKAGSPREAHDTLFRVLVTDETSATSLIRRYTPRKLARILTRTPPRLLDGTLIRPGRGKIHADALFEVEVRDGDKVFVQVIFEHLSGPDPGMPLRMLEYMAATWRRYAKSIRLRSLPAILPVVICHGPRHGLVPDSFLALINAPQALAGSLPLLDFGIEVHDLRRIPYPELADDPATRGVLCELKFSHSEDPPLKDLLAIARDLADRPEESLVRIEGTGYLLNTLRLSDERHEELLLSSEDREVRNMALMTFSERERMKGRTEGRAEGRAEIILAQLEERFGPIPRATVKRVRSADPEALKAWAKALIHARDLDCVFRPDGAG